MNDVLIHTNSSLAPFYVPGLVTFLEEHGLKVAIAPSPAFPQALLDCFGFTPGNTGCEEVYAPWEGTPPEGAIAACISRDAQATEGSLPPGMKLSLGARGQVALPSPEQIFEALAARRTPQDFQGTTVLITLGPTVEDFDPARYISNRSTGKMGVALAKMALRHGAKVIAIHGPMEATLPVSNRLTALPVRSAQQMQDAVMSHLQGTDIAILCAAVADFSPCKYSDEKIKKGKAATMELSMKRNPDILAGVGALPQRPFLIGFAAESNDVLKNAQEKMERKNCNMLCANDITAPGCGFAGNTNSLHVFIRHKDSILIPLASKEDVAEQLFQLIAKERQ